MARCTILTLLMEQKALRRTPRPTRTDHRPSLSPTSIVPSHRSRTYSSSGTRALVALQSFTCFLGMDAALQLFLLLLVGEPAHTSPSLVLLQCTIPTQLSFHRPLTCTTRCPDKRLEPGFVNRAGLPPIPLPGTSPTKAPDLSADGRWGGARHAPLVLIE
ncbi:hypothetical protein CALCODRAFT_160164 [Calocera cornea HHB12733]|uniref:Uncharacterized protein n=1 Tax=Calocera cornea HHB12733 TaxID=1353952 RepID=A0A165I2G5_9BASI|nr:hypothetical protein CALCODRAFT_160164 [Calocera cornea HHB12733]